MAKPPLPPVNVARDTTLIVGDQDPAPGAAERCAPKETRRSWPMPEGSKRLPSLIALSYFEAAARTRSFAAAAKELHITPAAISHQIKALEEHLGVELFVRHHRKVNLTPAATGALPSLQEGFAALADAVEQIRSYSEARWVITICAEPLFATKWLVPRLHRFYARCPEAEVRLQASLNSVDTVRGGPAGPATFRRAGIDLSVRFGYGEYAELDTRHLLAVSLIPVCSPDICKTLSTPQPLLRQPLLSDSTAYRSPERFGWPEWFRHVGVRPAERLREHRFGNGLLALEAAITGQGILLASKHLIQAELNAGKLNVAFNGEMPCPLAYYVVCPHPALERPIVNEFRDWLFEETATSNVKESLDRPATSGTRRTPRDNVDSPTGDDR